jgi:hypothetical protein
MKNQYFGDINDYKKYGILRILSGGGAIRTGICWMLTPDDDRKDGQFINYIDKPGRWRKYDPPLFDSLSHALKTLNNRNVALAEQLNIIENSCCHTNILNSGIDERRKYFSDLGAITKDCDLIFFDPDNGLEVKSKPYGQKDSNKYLYWREIKEFYEASHSLLIYQHFPRIEREFFTTSISKLIFENLNTSSVIYFKTSNVLFILIPQESRLDYFSEKTKIIEYVWGDEILVSGNLYSSWQLI